MSGALDAVLDRLRCPHCAAALTRDGGTLGCARGHRYDVARDGHVALLPPRGRRHAGDSAAMVAARAAFLAAGHFDPLTEALVGAARAAAGTTPGCAIDAGAGTGHQLAAVLDALPGWSGIALDVATAALRRAARAHPRAAAVGCDTWAALPLADGAAELALCVFAPRNGPELARVLAPEGALLVVTPAPDHLGALRAALGTLRVDPAKPERLRAALGPDFAQVAARPLAFELALGRDDARTLVAMGPSARHLDATTLEQRLAVLPEPYAVTASVRVETFSARPGASR